VLHGVDSPFRTTAINFTCSSQAMSAPWWHDRLFARFKMCVVVLSLSDKLRCSLCVLQLFGQTRARVPAASPAQTRRNRLCPTSSLAEHEFGFVVPLRHANPLHSFVPLDFFSRTHGSGSWLIVDPARTLRCCSLSVHLRAFALLHPGTDFVHSSCYVLPASRELACLHRCNVLPPILFFATPSLGLSNLD
jgi:hypothetical protein